MVGKIYPSFFKFKNRVTGKTETKSRPILIIAEPIGAYDTEYIVLPVSTISISKFYNSDYDVSLKVKDFPLLKITRDCYVRAHKQTTMYRSDIDFQNCIGDLKSDYPRVYHEVLEKIKKFNDYIMVKAQI